MDPVNRKKLTKDKIILIWAAAAVTGLFVFYWLLTALPRRDSRLIFYQWWEDELGSGALEKLVEDFREEYPDLAVTVERKSRAELKILFGEIRRNASLPPAKRDKKKRGPDILTVEGAWLDGVEAVLAPVAPGLDAVDGRAVPVISFINPLFYNIDLLQASGFDRPPKNQTEFLSYVQTITKPGQFGAAVALDADDPYSVSRHILSWIWSAGTEKFDFTSKQAVGAFTFLNQLKPYLYPDPFSVNEEQKLRLFIEGKTGMMIGPVSDVIKIRNEMKAVFGITTIPGPAPYVGKPVFPLESWYIGISAESERQEKAQTFITFLVEHASDIARNAFAVPGSGERDRGLIENDHLYAKAYEMYDVGEMALELYGTGGVKKLNGIIHEETKRMFDGAQNPVETAAAIQRRWEE